MIKRFTYLSVLTLTSLFFVSPAISQQAEKKEGQQKAKAKAPPLPGAGTGGNSPHATTSATIGPNRNVGSMVTITYGRPFATPPRGGERRKVWGGLVAWDKADRMGADEATTLINPHPLVFGSVTIPPGVHTLYIVPSETGTSKLAFSKNVGKWGIPVDEKSDEARIDLKKDTLDTHVEQLTIAVENTSVAPELSGVIKIMWENTQFSAPFVVKK
jgi:hypothetical protein